MVHTHDSCAHTLTRLDAASRHLQATRDWVSSLPLFVAGAAHVWRTCMPEPQPLPPERGRAPRKHGGKPSRQLRWVPQRAGTCRRADVVDGQEIGRGSKDAPMACGSDAKGEGSATRGHRARWRARAWIQAKRSRPRNRPDHRPSDTLAVGEGQVLVSSSGRQSRGRIAGRAAMTAAVMRDSTDNGRQRIDCWLIGRTRPVMIVHCRVMTVRTRGVPVAVACAETRAQCPAQRKHGKYGDNSRADALPPEKAHEPSISRFSGCPSHRDEVLR